jgi:hypothetical protein
MRKLLLLANAVLRKSRPWTPEPASSAAITSTPMPAMISPCQQATAQFASFPLMKRWTLSTGFVPRNLS